MVLPDQDRQLLIELLANQSISKNLAKTFTRAYHLNKAIVFCFS